MTRRERREAPRHNLQFQLKIRGIKNGDTFIGQAKLINISKVGFVFTPEGQATHPYTVGQVIEVEIMLPAPPTLQGRMSIKGKIVRTSMAKINPDEKREHFVVSVQFMDRFSFFRAGKDERIIDKIYDESR